jgi:hypothetical protein
MIYHTILHILFAVAGLLALLAAILDWNWFFRVVKTHQLMRRFSRRGSRWYYGLMGVVLITMAVLFQIRLMIIYD